MGPLNRGGLPENLNHMKRSEIKIRPARESDLAVIEPLWIENWVEHARQEPSMLDEDRMKKSDVTGYFRDALANTKSLVLVAEIDGHIAGAVKADQQDIPSFFRYPHIMYVDDLCVLPQYRRQGVAEVLLRAVEARARELGIKRLQARAYTFNVAVQQLNTKLGWRMPHSTWDKLLD
jgi:ribosomal protein S18 acetylase RimI-like enzyme